MDGNNTTIASKGIHFANNLCELGEKLDSKFYYPHNVINDYFVSVSTIPKFQSPASFPDRPACISTPKARFKVQPITTIEILLA